ncbi:MAG: alpha/beta hydrolase family protein [Dehalococcoidia bacterium]
MRRYRRALLIIGAFLVLLVALFAGLWANRYTRVALTTASMMPDLFVELPVSPLKLTSSEPVKEEVTFNYGSRPVVADLYRPSDGERHGAVVVVIGAAPRARTDPRAVRLAKSAARAGVVVMIPELKHLLRDEMVPEEIEALVAAFRYLREQEFVDGERLGFLGFSVGAGMALVAASDPRISDDVAFFGSFGGYYDLPDVIAAVTSETITYNDEREDWDPDEKTMSVLRRSLIYYVDEPNDRDILTRIFLEDDAPARQELAELSPRSRLIFELLDNRDSDRAQELLAQLWPQDAATLRRLSPSASIDGLRADLFIVHDRHDKFIPYAESRRLAEAARGQNDVYYAELDLFRHVDPTVTANPLTFLADLIQFFFQAYRLMLRLV